MKPLIKYVISLVDCVQLIKRLSVKKHRDAGYFFEILDFEVGTGPRVQEMDRRMYKIYRTPKDLVKLNIYYQKPNGPENSTAAQ